MGKFKKGDRVRVVRRGDEPGGSYHEATIGAVFTVDDIFDDEVHTEVWYFHPHEIELVPVAEATGTAAGSAQDDKPKFKVGDRVRVHGHPYYLSEDESTGAIISASVARGDWDVKLDNYGGDLSFLESELEPATLTIQPGKFYLTRDGRKVGPMRRWSDGEPWTATGWDRYWTSEGGRVFPQNEPDDLIAEWPSATNHDNASTAGFTIPVEAYAPEPDATLTTKITVDFSDFDAELDRIFGRLRKLKRKADKLGISLDASELQDAA